MLAATALTLTVLLLIAFCVTTIILWLRYKALKDDLGKNVSTLDSQIQANQKNTDTTFNSIAKSFRTDRLTVGSNDNPNYAALQFNNNQLDFMINDKTLGKLGMTGFSMSNLHAQAAKMGSASMTNAEITGTLSVKAAATFADLTASGNTTLNSIQANSLNINGLGTFSNLNTHQDLTVGKNLTAKGSITSDGTLTVKGLGSFSNIAVTGEASLGQLKVNNGTISNPVGNIVIQDGTAVTGDLSVRGTTTTSNLDVMNDHISRQPITRVGLGPFIQARNNNSDGERYGVGHFQMGSTRLYAGDLYPDASVSLSYAKGDGSFDDIVRVSKDPTYTTYNTTIKKGDLCMATTCINETDLKTLKDIAVSRQTAPLVKANTTYSATSSIMPSSTITYQETPTTTTMKVI